MAQKKNPDPVFVEYTRTAPRLDLAFYLVSIGRDRNLADPARYGAETPDAIANMVALYMDLIGPKPGSVASQKRAAWAAIDRYKASVPRYYGNANGGDGVTLPAGYYPQPEPVAIAPFWPTELTDDQIMERALMAIEAGRAILANRARAIAEPAPLVHAFAGVYFAVALCGASNADDGDAPATDDRAAVTCAACLAKLAEVSAMAVMRADSPAEMAAE